MGPKKHIPNKPVTDPRLLKIHQKFHCADERGKELMFRQAMAMPCKQENANG